MPEITEKDLKQQLKDGTLSGVYLIYGEENYLKSFYAGKITEKAVDKSLKDFNLHYFEGKGIDYDALSGAVEAYPVMSEKSCVVIKDIPADTLTKDDSEKLFYILSDVPETCIVVIWQEFVEVQPKKSAKWRNFIKDISAVGKVIELNKKSKSELVKLVCSGAQRRGCNVSPDGASYLIDLTGDDLTNLLSELEKVCAYVGNGDIKKADIDLTAVKTVDAAVFDLTKAIMSGSAERSFATLHTLLEQKIEPVLIMGALISAYVDMYRVKVCQSEGGTAQDAAKIFDYKNKEFRLRNAARDGANMTLRQIKNCLDELSQADEKLKSFSADNQIVMEVCITKLLLAAG